MSILDKILIGLTACVGGICIYAFLNMITREPATWVSSNVANYECRKTKSSYYHEITLRDEEKVHSFSNQQCLIPKKVNQLIKAQSVRVLSDGITFYRINIGNEEDFLELNSERSLNVTKLFLLIVSLGSIYYCFKKVFRN